MSMSISQYIGFKNHLKILAEMGVRGLKSYMERNNQTRQIDIGHEVQQWCRRNRNQEPIIVIDFLSITNGVVANESDTICGGRHQIALKSRRRLLDAFKATHATLVFFSDLNIQEGKIDESVSRRNEEFTLYTQLYDRINEGETLTAILAEGNNNKKALTSTFYGMAVIAHTYGKFHYSTKRECDLELAQYASSVNAAAVISNDTDFLIFKGSWRLWSPQDIHITQSNRLKTVEYNRYAIANRLSLSENQLPMFATLMGNDFTHSYYTELHEFHRSLGPLKYRIENIARYVRTLQFTDDRYIQQVVHHVFGYPSDKLTQLFRNSIDSYNTNFTTDIDDPIESKLWNTRMYRPYMGNKCRIHGITLPFYDMRGCTAETNLPMLLISWLYRRKAVVGASDDFILLAKKDISEPFKSHSETVIRPDFSIPPLLQLYNFDNTDLYEIRWKLFSWIMSFSDELISRLQKLPKHFLLICTTLYVLVKNGLLDTKVADGILFTENHVNEEGTTNVEYPVVLVSGYVRAAHIYNIAFSSVRQNFSIAGLLLLIKEELQFDGVYFQNLMKKFVH